LRVKRRMRVFFCKPTGDILKGLPQYFVKTVKTSSILHLISFGIKKTLQIAIWLLRIFILDLI
jgi:hypothetical protein